MISEIENDESRFKFLEKIGEGGIGIVYKAKDILLDRIVAIKKLNAYFIQNKDPDKILDEARACAKLRHRNIIRIYDIRKIKGDQCIIMEFIEGQNYRDILQKKGKLTLQEIVEIAKSLFAALDYSHRKGIVHKDIKPQNIMKDQDNEIKILDFGIAIPAQRHKHEEPGYFHGSPFYLAPEQITGESVDQRTDIYSAGAALFHLITGKVPFPGNNANEIFGKHIAEPVPSIRALRPEVPVALVELIECCMKKKKENRYQDAEKVLAKIDNIEKACQQQQMMQEIVDTMIREDGIPSFIEAGKKIEALFKKTQKQREADRSQKTAGD